ncbi:SMAD/FHA domain-containing protein [Delitschia confertaspora ATCC 74209]|uniref:SMAD/FHA domain-containing protein n=1 Tax=Delitschia confertaspora ATCC 74209 TaxID=1513339 RepID=A0A9P4MSY8_9PLEO|nr:SMAD/FHA domain-containing protein [Delitschia confertaspora ATCC 74209]
MVKNERSLSISDDDRGSRRNGRRSRSRSQSRDIKLERFTKREARSQRKRSTSRERRRNSSREHRRRHESARDSPRDRRPRNASTDRKRDRSREPYRQRRHRSQSRDRSPDRDRERRRHRDRSRDRHSRRSASPASSHSPKPKPEPHRRSRQPLPDQEISFRGLDDSAQPPTRDGGAPPDREKPNFKPSGLLAREANTVAGTKIALKYHEPPEGRKPPGSQQWRLFIFKGTESLGTVELYTQSCWLLGRAAEVADIVLGHPSCSSQHAAIQFRYIVKKEEQEDELGLRSEKVRGKVKPYLIDLESSNGTYLNEEKIEPGRYVELRDKDLVQFGGSEREYVVMLPPPEV